MQSNPQETLYLVTFTEEILNGNLHFLCSEDYETSEMSEYQSPEVTKLTHTMCVICIFIPLSKSLDSLVTTSQWKC